MIYVSSCKINNSFSHAEKFLFTFGWTTFLRRFCVYPRLKHRLHILVCRLTSLSILLPYSLLLAPCRGASFVTCTLITFVTFASYNRSDLFLLCKLLLFDLLTPHHLLLLLPSDLICEMTDHFILVQRFCLNLFELAIYFSHSFF